MAPRALAASYVVFVAVGFAFTVLKYAVLLDPGVLGVRRGHRIVHNGSMPNLTIVLGTLLLVVGVGFYVGTGATSVTALIPAFLGIPIAIAGFAALKEGWRKHAMHVAVLLALLGFLGSARGLVSLPALLTAGEVARPAAVAAQSLTALLCLVFVALAVNSFIQARRSA